MRNDDVRFDDQGNIVDDTWWSFYGVGFYFLFFNRKGVRVQGVWSTVWDLGYRVQGEWFRV